MKLRHASVLVAMFAIAAGCSSRSSFFFNDAGPEGGASTVRADSGTSGTKSDGGKTPTKDSGTTKDAGEDPPDPPTGCAPGDVSGFSPTWKAPAAFHQAGKCTSATQVESIIECAFEGTNCVDAGATAATCEACLFTPSSATKLGPIVIEGSVGRLNIAGCIANSEGNTGSTSCGAKYQAASQCADEACAANCPGDDQQALDDRNQCVQDALAGDCSSYATDAECANTLLDVGGAAAACNEGTTFTEAAIAIGKLFCLP